MRQFYQRLSINKPNLAKTCYIQLYLFAMWLARKMSYRGASEKLRWDSDLPWIAQSLSNFQPADRYEWKPTGRPSARPEPAKVENDPSARWSHIEFFWRFLNGRNVYCVRWRVWYETISTSIPSWESRLQNTIKHSIVVACIVFLRISVYSQEENGHIRVILFRTNESVPGTWLRHDDCW
jgi:hypothetical protein